MSPTLGSDLSDLLARVEAATGPDRELDCLICEWRHPEFLPAMRGTYYGDPTGEYFSAPNERGQQDVIFHARAVTASLDAALALCSRVLAGWRPSIAQERGGMWTVFLIEDTDSSVGLMDIRTAKSPHLKTPAVALLAAMLKALIASAASPENGPSQTLADPNILPLQGVDRDHSPASTNLGGDDVG